MKEKADQKIKSLKQEMKEKTSFWQMAYITSKQSMQKATAQWSQFWYISRFPVPEPVQAVG